MAKYLLYTNIILRLSNPSDRQNSLVTKAVATLLNQQNECYLTPQVLMELWVVATRPTDVNGLGWSVDKTKTILGACWTYQKKNKLLEDLSFDGV